MRTESCRLTDETRILNFVFIGYCRSDMSALCQLLIELNFCIISSVIKSVLNKTRFSSLRRQTHVTINIWRLNEDHVTHEGVSRIHGN